MDHHEYAVIPAPARGEKSRGAKSAGDRFAATLEHALNDMAARGWEYVRAETLPSEERSGLTSRTTVWNNVLVFRRAIPSPVTAPADPREAPASTPAPTPEPVAAPSASVVSGNGPTAASTPAAAQGPGHPFSQPMRQTAPAGPADAAAADPTTP